MNTVANRSGKLGPNGHGTSHWWWQRITALALVPLLVWLAVSALSVQIADTASVIHWMRSGIRPVLLCALLLVAAQHSYLGLRVIVDDYVSRVGVRAAMVVLLQGMHVLLAGAGVLSVLWVAIGAPP